MFSHALTLSRSHALLFLLMISCSCMVNVSDDTLSKSVEWMWQQQSEDGGWHSKTHAVLRDGRVLTPYILFHLMQLPEEYLQGKNQVIEKGIDFIIKEMRNSIDESKSALSDYPNYSAAYALRVLHKTNRDTALQRIIAEYLLSQQFIESRGIIKDHLAYGGWGYGEANLPEGQHGHVDISHTRRITEALMEWKDEKAVFRPPDAHPFATAQQPAKESIELFLKGVQRYPNDTRCYEGCFSRKKLPYDGGFVASVVTMSTIKSEPVVIDSAGIHYPSYATATCDGFLTMHALGMQETDAYQDAKKWLIDHQDMTTIDGLSPDDPEQWDEVMHYYHFAARSEAMMIIDPEGAWKKKISAIIENEQQPGGFFINPIGGVNKEDDPLMATIFCIQALNNIL